MTACRCLQTLVCYRQGYTGALQYFSGFLPDSSSGFRQYPAVLMVLPRAGRNCQKLAETIFGWKLLQESCMHKIRSRFIGSSWNQCWFLWSLCFKESFWSEIYSLNLSDHFVKSPSWKIVAETFKGIDRLKRQADSNVILATTLVSVFPLIFGICICKAGFIITNLPSKFHSSRLVVFISHIECLWVRWDEQQDVIFDRDIKNLHRCLGNKTQHLFHSF